MLIASSAPAQNLFVAGGYDNNIYEFTPGGSQSVFVSGLNGAGALAFDSAGNLLVTDAGGNIDKITPGGSQSVFASGLSYPGGLAFNSAGNLFEADNGSGNIYEFTPGGARSTFASGFSVPTTDGLAFQGVMLPVPEPSVLGLLAVGVSALLVHRRRRCDSTTLHQH